MREFGSSGKRQGRKKQKNSDATNQTICPTVCPAEEHINRNYNLTTTTIKQIVCSRGFLLVVVNQLNYAFDFFFHFILQKAHNT